MVSDYFGHISSTKKSLTIYRSEKNIHRPAAQWPRSGRDDQFPQTQLWYLGRAGDSKDFSAGKVETWTNFYQVYLKYLI